MSDQPSSQPLAPAPRRRFNWWFALIGLLMLVLALLTLSKCHTLVETSIEIDATPEQVWTVLSDLEHYSEWNPFITAAAGTPAEGGSVNITVLMPGDKTAVDIVPRVLEVEPGHELRWIGRLGGLPRVFDGEHYMVIDSAGQPAGRVKFVNGESFTGMLLPFMAKKLDTRGREGYEAMNAALAARIQTLYPALLPGSAVDFLVAPRGALIYRLQPSQISQGAAGTAGYTSYIAYFTAPAGATVDLVGLGDQLIMAGFDLKRRDSTDLEQQSDIYIKTDGSVEVSLGRFKTSKQVADMLASVGKPIFPEGFPAEFLLGDSYSGYRVELREFATTSADGATDSAPDSQALREQIDQMAPADGAGAPNNDTGQRGG